MDPASNNQFWVQRPGGWLYNTQSGDWMSPQGQYYGSSGGTVQPDSGGVDLPPAQVANTPTTAPQLAAGLGGPASASVPNPPQIAMVPPPGLPPLPDQPSNIAPGETPGYGPSNYQYPNPPPGDNMVANNPPTYQFPNPAPTDAMPTGSDQYQTPTPQNPSVVDAGTPAPIDVYQPSPLDNPPPTEALQTPVDTYQPPATNFYPNGQGGYWAYDNNWNYVGDSPVDNTGLAPTGPPQNVAPTDYASLPTPVESPVSTSPVNPPAGAISQAPGIWDQPTEGLVSTTGDTPPPEVAPPDSVPPDSVEPPMPTGSVPLPSYVSGGAPSTTDPGGAPTDTTDPTNTGDFSPDGVASGQPLPGSFDNLGSFAGGNLGNFGSVIGNEILKHAIKFGIIPPFSNDPNQTMAGYSGATPATWAWWRARGLVNPTGAPAGGSPGNGYVAGGGEPAGRAATNPA